MKTRYRLAVVLLSLRGLWPASVLALTTAEHLAQIPLPFDARVLSVGNDVEHNGQRLSLATFQSSSSVDDTVAFYRQLWENSQEDDKPGMVVNRVGEWLVIGQLQDGFQSVLQLKLQEPHRSEGFLSVMRVPVTPSASAGPGLLPGMERLSTTRSRDAGRASTLSIHLSTEAVEPVARQLAGFWQGKGWSLVSNEPYSQSRVLRLNRQSAQLDIVVTPSQQAGSLVIMNEVDDDD